MKLRYYLRGLGIGIFVTALIMGLNSEAGTPLTDAEIRAKALELGMVEEASRTLSDTGGREVTAPSPAPSPSQSPVPSTSPSPDASASESPDPSASPSPVPSPSQSPVPTSAAPGPVNTEEPAVSPEAQGTEPSGAVPSSASPSGSESGTVTIRVVRGDSSYTVSRRLEEAGLVEDAREFDDYLVENGYSKTVRTGDYQIPYGATWEEIAGTIAR